MNGWNIIDRDMHFDGGHTATDRASVQLERDLHFSNGSGDDLYDAVHEALAIDNGFADEGSNLGLDPLDILIAEEELDDII